ncbi:MAG: 1-acyl-sn-glycerol-3-phosphate acyltransferase [Proteobacteria bacterium]|nr:1-acyl-sn-glycerol-3-phosphate acyltransferase [Pseudomonadota bacterium]NDC23437.1 1-acyl-sn-glycerol-3-phosphate acyltransferase [Pseudomonadota bacterium]NDD03607.1 1-acyl-sn-glycerol-3-phosphate acyltransferase [Pseudomonadota bacterium]NDG25980.1 1-acyl-sn-glycerol-3-phosphate acyltransferase [Pseudomonadota bacterium]
MITQFFKAISLACALLFHLVIASGLLIALPDTHERRLFLVQWMHHCSRIILQILDISFWVEDQTTSPPPAGTLFLANHVSYIDALILSAQYPAVFVTSHEVRDTVFLGWLARCSGCVFVERRGFNTLKRDISDIRDLLASGLNVIIFPEGTTSDGSQILPFKQSLLEAAVGIASEVRPICVNYRYCNGQTISLETSKHLFYFGEMNLIRQLISLFGVFEVVVEIILRPALTLKEQSCRKKLAEASRLSIRQVFAPILDTGTAL